VFDKTIIESLLLVKSRRYSPQMSYSLKMINSLYCMISRFRREVAENCALLGYYAGRSGNFYQEEIITIRCVITQKSCLYSNFVGYNAKNFQPMDGHVYNS
jgi:hypothetical protein